jgi:pimeloyl-ACP methyl ester carboxylesterase
MQQYVLVPGAWHGAWCWARVLPLLRAAGCVSHAVTLTGVGDRAHLFSTGIRLGVHIQDVINLLTCEELDNVVLVGHSTLYIWTLLSPTPVRAGAVSSPPTLLLHGLSQR